jgi:hypothetical protein
MNERIRLLAEQANDYANHLDKIGVDDGWQNIFNQKFAQLIVRECADIAKHNVMNISTYADANFVDAQIKKHFGVEE